MSPSPATEAARAGAGGDEGHARAEALRQALAHAAHYLPDQGPIGVFIHHNTLHAFQHLPFHEAIAKASALFGAEPYMPEEEFRRLLASGRITEDDLDAALAERAEVEGWPSRAHAGGRLSSTAVRSLALRHSIVAETAAGLRFKLAEGSLAAGLPESAPAATRALWEACRRLGAAPARPPAPARRVGPEATHRDLLLELTGEDVNKMVNPVLIRTSAAYLDEGMAYWPMPAREQGYYRAVRALLSLPGAGPEPWLRAACADLHAQAEASADAARVALDALDDLGVLPADFEPYLTRVLCSLPGWAGMMSRLERHPEDRPGSAPPASLLDFLAVRLTLERAALRDVAARRLRLQGPLSQLAQRSVRPVAARDDPPADHDVPYRLFRLFSLASVPTDAALALSTEEAQALVAELDAFDALARRRVFQEAYERQHRRTVLDALAENRKRGTLARPPEPPRFQFVFCIDEREESIRRALEELSPEHETFGVAGFFGMAIDYRGLDDPRPVPLCPVVATPAHEVHERPRAKHGDLHRRRTRLRRTFARLAHDVRIGSRSLMRGLLLSLGLGVVPAVPLVSRLLFPRATGRLRERLGTALLPAPETELTALRDADSAPGDRGKHLGFTAQEAADRVGATLVNIGLTRGFARVIAVLGHGSSSQNNPHASAYDCGACGGRRGGANARLFAELANRAEVRALLRARGIDIPESSVFVGGLHNTSTSAVTLHDADRAPEAQEVHLRALREALDRARAMCAQERCRRFASAPRALSPSGALRHVETRTESLSEPRPECGHATNAVCVVGRRALTSGLFLDRRAFLVSYDPAVDDAQGTVLERILAAVGPVGAGINLEYYFSFVDNEIYGCGTKLPHNVTSLLGVMNGHASDLRTGLPWQMVEIHEPVRLLLIVEATPERVLAIAARQPEVRELVVNRWIQLVTLHPDSGAMRVFTERGFVPYAPSTQKIPVMRASADWYRGHIDHLPPALIDGATSPLAEAVSHAP